jgi:hypothetical protein
MCDVVVAADVAALLVENVGNGNVGTPDWAAVVVTESTTMVGEKGFGMIARGLLLEVGLLVLLLATAVTECLIPRDELVEIVAAVVLLGWDGVDDGCGMNPAASGGGGGDGLLLDVDVSIDEVQSSSKSAISL